MLGVCDARDYGAKSPKKISEGSPIRHPKSLKPSGRGIAIAVVKMATYKAKKRVERVRSTGAVVQAPRHLGKIVQHASEVGG